MTRSQETSARLARWRKLAAVLLLALPVVVVVLYFLRFSLVHGVFNLGVEKVSTALRLDENLARALVALLGIPFLISLREALSFFSTRRQMIGTAGIAVYVAVYSVAAWSVGRSTYFDEEGARRWYALRPDGSCYEQTRPGVDPVYGNELKPMTAEVVDICRMGRVGAPEEIASLDDVEFVFHPGTGDPQIWYTRIGVGEIRLFDRPGFDPRTGQKLEPVTRSVVEEVIRQQEMRREAERGESEIAARTEEAAPSEAEMEHEVADQESRTAPPLEEAGAREAEGAKEEALALEALRERQRLERSLLEQFERQRALESDLAERLQSEER